MIGLSFRGLLIYGQLLALFYILKFLFYVLLRPANEKIIEEEDTALNPIDNDNILHHNIATASFDNHSRPSNTSIIKIDLLYSRKNREEIRESIDNIRCWIDFQNLPALTPCVDFGIFFLDDEILSREVLIQLFSTYRAERLHVLIDYIYYTHLNCFENCDRFHLVKALNTLLLAVVNDVSEEYLITDLLSNILPISRSTHAYDIILTWLKMDSSDFIESVITSECVLRNSGVKLGSIYNFKLSTNMSSAYSQIFPYTIKGKDIVKPGLREIKSLDRGIWNTWLLSIPNYFDDIVNLRNSIIKSKLAIGQWQNMLGFPQISALPLDLCPENKRIKAIQCAVTTLRIVEALLRESEEAFVVHQFISLVENKNTQISSKINSIYQSSLKHLDVTEKYGFISSNIREKVKKFASKVLKRQERHI